MPISFNSIHQYSHKLTLLYVAEESPINNKINTALKSFFGEILSAHNGEKGLASFVSCHEKHGRYPDIVLTDMLMPKLNGAEMSEKIFDLNSSQVLVMLTNNTHNEIIFDLINMGVGHFMVKPIKKEQFYSVLYKVSKPLSQPMLPPKPKMIFWQICLMRYAHQ